MRLFRNMLILVLLICFTAAIEGTSKTIDNAVVECNYNVVSRDVNCNN